MTETYPPHYWDFPKMLRAHSNDGHLGIRVGGNPEFEMIGDYRSSLSFVANQLTNSYHDHSWKDVAGGGGYFARSTGNFQATYASVWTSVMMECWAKQDIPALKFWTIWTGTWQDGPDNYPVVKIRIFDMGPMWA